MTIEKRPVRARPVPPAPGTGGGRQLLHRAIRLSLTVYNAAHRVVRAVRGPCETPGDRPCRILLTGTFNSTAWVEHHLTPLARSSGCAGITVVATSPMPVVEKVSVVRPPEWLTRTAGSAAARLITLAVLALRDRPDIVGGFHLLFNGLAAALIAPIAGARSMYFCVGGPMEVLDGGIRAENKLFNRLGAPDEEIERLLIRAIASIDIVITMGHGAASFLRSRGVTAEIHVIPGGLDLARYRPSTRSSDTDIVFVGRFVPIKRPVLLLEAIARLKLRMPAVSATLIGDGPLREQLDETARDLGLDGTVAFAGHRSDVLELLPRARLFVLTSESEGVSLSLMEALACGVPAVVSRVGDLADVVEDGVNGFLIDGAAPEAFAARMLELLTDERRRLEFSAAARRTAEGYAVGAITRRWDDVLRAVPSAESEVAAGRRAISAGADVAAGE